MHIHSNRLSSTIDGNREMDQLYTTKLTLVTSEYSYYVAIYCTRIYLHLLNVVSPCFISVCHFIY